MDTSFASRLRMLRKEQRMTQKEVGEVLHYGYTAIANYEAGRTEPSFADLIRLAEYFSVSTDYLLGRTEVRTYPPDDADSCADIL
ncbi:MAG TPA: helix-turn-helix domain-containing protein [Firmicutes bacterium]|nr:helix-turn-helix domain-containing protein [Bacillota bacterium]